MTNILEISNLNHSFPIGKDSISVLKGINLTVKQGEFIAVVGKSGSGKSTLLNLIAGFTRPKSGSISILQKDVTKLSENKMAIFRQKNIGFIFQAYNLISTMTAFENIELPLELAGIPKKYRSNKVDEIIGIMNLSDREDHYPGELSGGEQQRVGIGRAIILQPKIILADEPTGNLDSDTEKQIINSLIEINTKMKTTLIVVTHDMEIAQCAHRIIHIKDGRIEP